MVDNALKKALRSTTIYYKKLDELGIVTIDDLLHFFPSRLEDTTAKNTMETIVPEEMVTLRGELISFLERKGRFGKKIINGRLRLSDGGMLSVIWFHTPYQLRTVKLPQSVFLIGKVQCRQGEWQISSPELHLQSGAQVDRPRPVYPQSPPITSRWLRDKIYKLLSTNISISDPLPDSMLAEEKLLAKNKAVESIHFPKNEKIWQQAKHRLALEELFIIQLRVMLAKQEREKNQTQTTAIAWAAEEIKADLHKLSFALTTGQKIALNDILSDLESTKPMHRLLQGDVGSGKTIVFFLAAMAVWRAGGQVVILSPTEILARQHWQTLLESNLLPELQLMRETALLLGGTREKEKKDIKKRVSSGDIKLLIGTHAVLTPDVVFPKLNLAIIDEQHRFGVEQRATLANFNPHLLAATATPIPRTLALTIYGDQDLSVITELPSGRQETITRVVFSSDQHWQMCYFIADKIKKLQQVFWVCPLVTESEALKIKDVHSQYATIKEQLFPNFRSGLLHGRMPSKDKEAIMKKFAQQELDILVATSVIEVGVDVPEANIMVIENSERFGLAQLHQLRGRVGRGRRQSYCFLLTDNKEKRHSERLRAMERSSDGFYLAKVDLQLRGAGEVYGLKQSGMPDLKCADLSDSPMIDKARHWAARIMSNPQELNKPALQTELSKGKVYF